MTKPIQDIIWQHIADCPKHITQLATWFQDEWRHYNPECSVQSRSEELKAKIDKNKLPLTMVATANGEILGTYSLDLSDLAIRPNLSPWLASVFVNPKYRKQGIGTLLVKESLRQAYSLGIGTFYLFTKRQQAPWYTSMGWQTIEELFCYGEDIIIMQFSSTSVK